MSARERPIFLVGAPFSGASALFRALSRHPQAAALDAAARAELDRATLESEPLGAGTGADVKSDPAVARRVRAALAPAPSRDATESRAPAGRPLDGAPRNSLRIHLLASALPGASFVYVYRHPRESVATMIAAWRSGEFVTHPRLPGWDGPPWSLLLVPGWRRLAGCDVAEIAASQWADTTRIALDDLDGLPPERWSVVDHEALLRDPGPELRRLCAVLGLEWEADLASSFTTADPIRPNGELEAELDRVLPLTLGIAERARDLLAAPVSSRPTAVAQRGAAAGSVHTPSLARLLGHGSLSLALATADAGKLVFVRADGARLETVFRDLRRPTAVAAGGGEIAVLDDRELLVFGPGSTVRRDADGVGALAYAGRELWLCSKAAVGALRQADDRARLEWRSVLPARGEAIRWRLTGIAADDGRPRFLTASAGGASRGGCVIELRTGTVRAAGLPRPLAPRLHDGRLFVLEAGSARLLELGPATARREVAELPGTPRGLAIHQGIAFVAVSAGRGGGRRGSAGVWAIEIERGATVGFLRFEGAIATVADVAVVASRHADIRQDSAP